MGRKDSLSASKAAATGNIRAPNSSVSNFQNAGIIQNDMVALSGNMFPILMRVRTLLPPENHGLIVIRQARTQ